MSIKLLKKIHCLVESITGETFYIAGGAVVDTLYGKEPKDYDMVLCVGEGDAEKDTEAHHLIVRLSGMFSSLGFTTKVYQSYGINMGEDINETSFQAMFYSCMKVQMGNCHLDILLSRADCIEDHVKRHDCNMNMVWFDGQDIRWEHGGKEPKVETLVFNPDVCEERIARMVKKSHALVASAI